MKVCMLVKIINSNCDYEPYFKVIGIGYTKVFNSFFVVFIYFLLLFISNFSASTPAFRLDSSHGGQVLLHPDLRV